MFGLDFAANAVVICIVTLFSAIIVTFGYHNTFFKVNMRLLSKRDARSNMTGDARANQLKVSILTSTSVQSA